MKITPARVDNPSLKSRQQYERNFIIDKQWKGGISPSLANDIRQKLI